MTTPPTSSIETGRYPSRKPRFYKTDNSPTLEDKLNTRHSAPSTQIHPGAFHRPNAITVRCAAAGLWLYTAADRSLARPAELSA